MKLKRLLSGIDHRVPQEMLEVEVTGVAYDSRRVVEGSCFVAIKGFHSDGHDFIEQALNQGAAVIVYEDASKLGATSQWEAYHHVIFVAVEDSRKVLALLSCNFYENPAAGMNLIGVTGTNGKTSITQILSNMLEALGESTAVIGTIGNRIGQKVYKTANTTPESLELNQLFSEMRDIGTDSCVMEVSSHSLELNRVYGIDFDIAVFTNLTEDHLDFHLHMENYYNAKAKLFDMTGTGSVINVDDPYGERLYKELSSKGYNVITYGCSRQADLYADNIELKLDGVNFDLCTPDFITRISSKLPGRIYIYNILAAVGTLLMKGHSRDEIELAIKAIQPIRGRMETIPNKLGYNVLVDFAHTPDALEKLLKSAKEFTGGKLVAIFGCGGNRDRTKRPVMGRIAFEGSDIAIITNDNPRNENPLDIIADIQAGIPTGQPDKIIVLSDRQAAIEKGLSLLNPGDTLVIAGKGHETYQIIGDEVLDFDDRAVAMAYIENIERK